MPIGLLKDIMHEIPRGVRLLGIDVGTKTLGLAVCDPDHNIATPLKTLVRSKFTQDMKILAQIIEDYEIGGFVIGLPLNMDGSEGRRCQSVRDFAMEMQRFLKGKGSDPWIALWDERLSTETVEDFVDKSVSGSRRRAKERGLTDRLAARHILQTALDFVTHRF